MDGMSDRLNVRLAELTEKRSRPLAPEVKIEEADAPPNYEKMVLKERNVERTFAGLKLKIRRTYRDRFEEDVDEAYRAGAEAGDRIRCNAGELNQ